MKVYCTSKNTGPSYQSEHTYMVYLGTSLTEAENSVGNFTRYENMDGFRRDLIKGYSALPRDVDWEMVKFYMADGWWYSIVSFELENQPLPSLASSNDLYMYIDGPMVGHIVPLPRISVGNFRKLVGGKLSKEEFPKLYEVLEGRYGEDEETFTLPDLRARIIEKENNV